MLDGFLQWKSKQLARATPFEVHIYPHVSVGDGLSALGEEMSYSPIQIHEPARDLPLKFYQAHPVMGKKILCFFFEPEGERELSFVLTGNTWTVEGTDRGVVNGGVGDGVVVPGIDTDRRNFRDDLERAGISGSRNESGGYYRLRTETKRGVPRSRTHTHTLSLSEAVFLRQDF